MSALETAKEWELRLYTAGKTSRAVKAFENLQRISEEHLAGRYHIKIIDLIENPTLARGD
jgi:circadian clock protein KaiB